MLFKKTGCLKPAQNLKLSFFCSKRKSQVETVQQMDGKGLDSVQKRNLIEGENCRLVLFLLIDVATKL